MKKTKNNKKELTAEEKSIRRKKRLERYNPIMGCRNAIRREFSRSPIVQEMMRENKKYVPKYKSDGSRAKIDTVMHLCNICKEWKTGKFTIDHIDPVVDPDVGFIDFNTYYKRMFVSKEKLQKLCFKCHNAKTNEELQKRMFKYYDDILKKLENSIDIEYIKEEIKRFTKSKLKKCSQEIVDRVISIKSKLNN